MRNLFLVILFLPCFCFSQERLVSSDDDVWINAKLKIYGVYNSYSIDSILGHPDSVYTPELDVIGAGTVQFNPIVSYPNADLEISKDLSYSISKITFVKQPMDFFINFGKQILTANTSIDEVKQHFYYHWLNSDSTEYAETISGKNIRVKRLEIYNPYPIVTDGPTWVFDFFEDKLVRITFVEHGG